MLLTGTGIAWFDNPGVELNGKPYTNPQLFDLDFEAPILKGFAGGGTDYETSLDNTAAWTGRQSLKLQFTANAARK